MSLADCDDDALPTDHRAETQCDCYRDLDPGRDELRGAVERLLVGIQGRQFFYRQLATLILHQIAQSFASEIHAIAGIADGPRRGFSLANRTALPVCRCPGSARRDRY